MVGTNKICLITGASSGIGKYIAHEMVHRGWRVIAVARSNNNFDHVKDVSTELKNKNLYPTLFFLNAGDGDEENDKELDWEFHKRIFDVNYFGTISWVNQWINLLKEKDGGVFVVTSSIQSYRGMPGAAAYGASKSALNHCFESLDAMYYKDNIRFSIIYPGPVDTAMLKTDKPFPFTWKPKKAAKYIVKKVLKGSTKIKFPLFWVILMGIVKLLPNKLYLRIFRMK
jgi:short-subunit dehydrogenase